MRSLVRITLVIIVLVGGTAFFGYWSMNQFNQAYDDLGSTYLASTYSARRSFELAASSTVAESTATSTVTEFSFTFPNSNTQAYMGCTYPISWESPTNVDSLEAVLVDAGTRETIGPRTSGLATESSVEDGSRELSWKIGSVWPGAYYIKISKINDLESEIRSKIFMISKMPRDISTSEQESICGESGGSL